MQVNRLGETREPPRTVGVIGTHDNFRGLKAMVNAIPAPFVSRRCLERVWFSVVLLGSSPWLVEFDSPRQLVFQGFQPLVGEATKNQPCGFHLETTLPRSINFNSKLLSSFWVNLFVS